LGNGTALKATNYKVGVQAPYYARLGRDGILADGGEARSSIEEILSSGTYLIRLVIGDKVQFHKINNNIPQNRH